ncbi:MAG: LuxR family transcriptional regulator [Nocardioidaceae bacterium]|nr:LuxR family transcriptional regulator [Nocardioidaceae bacterium]
MTLVTGPAARLPRGLVQMVLVSAVVVMVSIGLARGVWLSNLHNAALALAFTLVGTYVLVQRPGHREGRLFLATGVVEAVLFLGRQIGHAPGRVDDAAWWAWAGVWPVAIALALVTAAVVCFPDGRLPSPRWRPTAGLVVVLAAVCAALSALWPVEYAAAGVVTVHPLHATAPVAVSHVWNALAHPSYVGFQVLWVVAVAARWRSSGGHVRRQLTWLVLAAAVSVAALGVGLAVGGSPTPGLLAAALVPLAAGWAIVHGQHVAAYSALTWLSRTGPESRDLPTDHARAVAEALGSRSAILWMGTDELHAVGVWPETDDVVAPTSLAALRGSPVQHLREVTRHGTLVGAVTASRVADARLSLARNGCSATSPPRRPS